MGATLSRVLKPTLPGVLVGLTLLGVLAPVLAQAFETVKLHTSFSPNQLGAATTISFRFEVATNNGELPSPLRHVSLSMPGGMNYLTSTLGTSTCEPAVLINRGVQNCPPNSRLGFGSAYAEVPFGSSRAGEPAEVQAFMGQPQNGNVVVLFFVEGNQPVWAPLVFQGELVPASAPFGETLSTAIPLITSVPGGPPVSILRVSSTIGPQHLTYYKQVHGRRVSYHPSGVELPEKCPKHGFRFVAQFAFEDNSEVTATSTVPCHGDRRLHSRRRHVHR